MKSMTGYGRRQMSVNGREMTLEIKTVNHRFLDISFRLQKSCSFLEDALRRQVQSKLARGHADILMTYVNRRADARKVNVDLELAVQYREAVQQLAERLQAENDVKASFFAGLPGVLSETEGEEDQEAVKALLSQLTCEVLDDVLAMREKEGEVLKKDLSFHIDALEALMHEIEALAPSVPGLYRERLLARIEDARLDGVDPQRVAQEVALFADKCAIDEEISRLKSHTAQMREALSAVGETGRRLDFLTQELNREVNTIGSKSADVRITSLVVSAKSEIEKLREQVQNVE